MRYTNKQSGSKDRAGHGGYMAYVYDAEGNRVAKGTVNALSCDFSSNGFTATTSYVVGLGGKDLTEFAVQNGQWAWSHSDVYEGGQLLATYSANDTYFDLHDWLGTKRVEVTPDSLLSTFASLPFGDGLTATGNAPDVSAKHFTGKERDPESGLDYFGARYYASSMGHWMSPDWSAKAEPVPYAKLDSPQTLNLYSYVENNPITGFDPDGHYRAAWLGGDGANVGASQAQDGINQASIGADEMFASQVPKTPAQPPAQQELSPQSEAAIENSALNGEQAGALESAVKAAGGANGIDPNALVGIAMNESSLNPTAQNPASSASGLFGLTDNIKTAYGLSASDATGASASAITHQVNAAAGYLHDLMQGSVPSGHPGHQFEIALGYFRGSRRSVNKAMGRKAGGYNSMLKLRFGGESLKHYIGKVESYE